MSSTSNKYCADGSLAHANADALLQTAFIQMQSKAVILHFFQDPDFVGSTMISQKTTQLYRTIWAIHFYSFCARNHVGNIVNDTHLLILDLNTVRSQRRSQI